MARTFIAVAAGLVWPFSTTASMMELPLAPGMFPLGSGAVPACMVAAPEPEKSGKMQPEINVLQQLKAGSGEGK